MKKTFLTFAKHLSVTAALLVLVFAPFTQLISVARAVVDPNSGSSSGGSFTPQNSGDPSTGGGTTFSNTSPTSASFPAPPSGSLPESNCALASGGSFFSSGDWAQCITDVIYVFTVGIGSGFAYVSAYFFDWAIALSLNGSAYALDFVAQGWTTARDIANMAFLFILLYIAFKIMFLAETNETVHMLVVVIVIALLVNFSFFFTRLAIDAGNILSIQFYNAIQVPSLASTAQGQGVQGQVLSGLNAVGGVAGANMAGQTKDLTAGIMGMLNLQGLLGNESFKAFRESASYNFLTAFVSLTFLYISAAIMLWILTVAFVTNGVKFLFRIVILWFLIIASPLAFVARAVPKFESYYKKWQDELIKHAFYPVAFMFIFLILTNFAKQMSGKNGLIDGIFAGLSTTPANTGYVAQMAIAVANVGIRMGFVIAMLYIGMKAAEQIGVMGAEAANHAGNWVGSKMIGTYGAVGRNTAGWAAYRASNAGWARKLETKTGLLAPLGVLSRGFRATTGAVGRASFDARGVPGAGSVLKDVGKPQKGGFESAVKETVEAKEKKLKAVEPSEAQKTIALASAEKETNYVPTKASHEAVQSDAKEKLEGINSRLEELKDKGEAGSPEADRLRLERRTEQARVTMSTRALDALEKATKARANKISGEGLSKEYANVLSKPNIRNLGIPWRSSKEAAAKVRKGKSHAEQILEVVKKAAKEDEKAEDKEEPPAAAPTAPIPPTGGGSGSGGH